MFSQTKSNRIIYEREKVKVSTVTLQYLIAPHFLE